LVLGELALFCAEGGDLESARRRRTAGNPIRQGMQANSNPQIRNPPRDPWRDNLEIEMNEIQNTLAVPAVGGFWGFGAVWELGCYRESLLSYYLILTIYYLSLRVH